MDLQIIILIGILVVLAGILVTLIRIFDSIKKGHIVSENKTLISIADHVSWLAGAVGVKNLINEGSRPTTMRNMANPVDERANAQEADMSGGGNGPIGRPKNYVSVEVIDPAEAI